MNPARKLSCLPSASIALWLSMVAAPAAIFTTNTVIGINNTNYEGQDIIAINCTLTVDGPHSFSDVLLLSGARLTHSFSSNGFLTVNNAVTDEALTLVGANSSALANNNVQPTSVVITDTNHSVTYVLGQDYLAQTNGIQFQIARTAASAIPDGAVVLVSYAFTSQTVSAGLNLSVFNNVIVENGCAIDVGGVGFGPQLGFGPGASLSGGPFLLPSGSGGGFGGFGGSSASFAPGGSSFGDTASPINLGSGGGAGFGPGGSGGGAIKLVVGGALFVDGQVLADGANGVNSGSGGGSGGSVRLTAQTFGGAGSISANGGAGELFEGGGGGGGRIAIYFGTTEFTGAISARGGAGVTPGGAGTIYTRLTNTPAGQVLADNAGQQGANTIINSATEAFDLSITGGASVIPLIKNLGNLFVNSNSWITGSQSITVSVGGNATFQAGGGINLDGKGSAAGQGLGAGLTRTTNNIQIGSGAGYGGFGASSFGLGGNSYGSFGQPTDLGSGGGVTGTGFNLGGSGGGAVRLTVTSNLLMNGYISANGNSATGSTAGGGSGGSIWLTAGTFSGSGILSANGGAGDSPYGGGGGGGRIAIYASSNSFAGIVSAFGGAGVATGGAGTVFTGQSRNAFGSLVINNGGQPGTNTPISNPGADWDLIITGGATALGSNSLGTIRNLTIASNSFFTYSNAPQTAPHNFTLQFSGNATIQAGGGIIADGRGFLGGQGTGAGGQGAADSAGGGGHGGFGGGNSFGTSGGIGYGSITAPTEPGSGGGLDGGLSAGSGGGALTINVTGILTVDGFISANGTTATGFGSGGGSGGSIWLTVGSLSGAGRISANGGGGNLAPPNGGGGGGGGGRIAIIYNTAQHTNQFAGTISVLGGPGINRGGAGTIYSRRDFEQFPQLIIDGGGFSGANTSMTQFGTADVTITGGATVVWSNSASMHNLVITSNSFAITPLAAPGPITLTVSGDANIQNGGGVNADGLGSGANAGSGRGSLNSSPFFGSTGTGGSYGGTGGASAGGPILSQPAYGLITQSPTIGSGGGSANATGSAGGGLVRLMVTGTLTIDGAISANGTSPGSPAGGGGSGGGVSLSTGTLKGAGLIAANGAAGDLPYGGGGGGGRVSITYNSNLFTGALSAHGGLGFVSGGAGTIFLRQINSTLGQLTINNAGIVGATTPVAGEQVFNGTIIGGAVVVPLPTGPQALTFSNLLVDTGGVLTVPSAPGTLSFTVNGDALIGTTGAISVDSRGYNGTNGGPGAGLMTNNPNFGGSGGGYGGAGGASISGTPGGSTYGSLLQPVDFGSRGGLLPILPNLNAGGGAVKLAVGGHLTVNGKISANGNNAIFDGSGGGAGGSIWLSSKIFDGNGVITANGGAGEPASGGGGGGGRVAIYYGTNSFLGTTTALGGHGAFNGQDGTLSLGVNPPIILAGTVTDTNGLPVGSVSLQATGGTPFNTDVNGNFSVPVPWGWSGSLFPSSPGLGFAPAFYGYKNVTGPITNQNFTMMPLSLSASVAPSGAALNLNWFGVTGVNYHIYNSTNLVDWQPYGAPIVGTNGAMNVALPISSDPQMFFRLQIGN